MMGSIGVMIITPDTTHSAPDILPPVKNTKRKCHDFWRNGRFTKGQDSETDSSWIHQFVCRSFSFSVAQCFSRSTNLSVSQSVIGQLVNKTVNQPICQSVSQSARQSDSQSISPSAGSLRTSSLGERWEADVFGIRSGARKKGNARRKRKVLFSSPRYAFLNWQWSDSDKEGQKVTQ